MNTPIVESWKPKAKSDRPSRTDIGKYYPDPSRTNFWKSEEAGKYEDFATSIPSDHPAYDVVHHLVNPKDKHVLDFGCYQGQSSKWLLDAGAARVVGVDNVAENIAQARQKFRDCANLSFLEVPSQALLPSDLEFDSAAMTFVHPAINNKTDLFSAILKTQLSLRPGGSLTMLGLHPNSFFESARFLYYGHQIPAKIADGVPFQNELRLPGGQVIRFIDFHWRTETLVSILHDTRFAACEVIDLTLDLPGPAGDALRKSVESLDQDWKGEWKIPLYQIIQARK